VKKYFNKTHLAISLFIALFVNISSIKAQNWDLRLLDKLNGPPAPGPDKRWEFITSHASWIDTGIPLGLVTTGILKKDPNTLKNGIYMGICCLSNGIITQIVKVSNKRARPFEVYPDLIYKKSEAGSYSFPSGHTSSAFSTATSISLMYHRWYVVVPAYTYAASIGYSRMYLGVHYPSDVLAGALLGSGTAYLNWKLNKALHKKRKA
jgi:membrane-associated phospholipid phosphatase